MPRSAPRGPLRPAAAERYFINIFDYLYRRAWFASQRSARQLGHHLAHLDVLVVSAEPEVLGGQPPPRPGGDHGGADHRILDVTARHIEAFGEGVEVDAVVDPGLRRQQLAPQLRALVD